MPLFVWTWAREVVVLRLVLFCSIRMTARSSFVPVLIERSARVAGRVVLSAILKTIGLVMDIFLVMASVRWIAVPLVTQVLALVFTLSLVKVEKLSLVLFIFVGRTQVKPILF